MWAKTVNLLIAMGCLISIQAAKKGMTVEVRNLTCLHSVPLKYLECNLKRLGRGRDTFNISFLLDRQLANSAEFNILIHMQNGKKVVKFLDFKINICEYLSNGMSVPIVKEVLNEVLRSSNFPRKCPYKGNTPYNLYNFDVDIGYVPMYIPELNFNFTMQFYEGQKIFGKVFAQAATVKK